MTGDIGSERGKGKRRGTAPRLASGSPRQLAPPQPDQAETIGRGRGEQDGPAIGRPICQSAAGDGEQGELERKRGIRPSSNRRRGAMKRPQSSAAGAARPGRTARRSARLSASCNPQTARTSNRASRAGSGRRARRRACLRRGPHAPAPHRRRAGSPRRRRHRQAQAGGEIGADRPSAYLVGPGEASVNKAAWSG